MDENGPLCGHWAGSTPAGSDWYGPLTTREHVRGSVGEITASISGGSTTGLSKADVFQSAFFPPAVFSEVTLPLSHGPRTGASVPIFVQLQTCFVVPRQ